MRYPVLFLILPLVLSLLTAIPAAAEEAWPEGPDISSETGVLMDMETGTILYNKDMDRQMYPASITKIMTTLLALENGNLSDVVTMTATGTAYAVEGSSNLYTVVGEQFTLEQLLYGTMLKSANDMATQVGEYIGGTLEHFVEMMNEKAAELGCTGTHFNNACGMPDPDHYTTAHDMALISREALKIPKFLEIIGTHTYAIPPTNMNDTTREFASHVPLLVNPDYAYPGILGGKTGYTDAAQNTFASFVSQEGRTLIAVTMSAGDILIAAEDHTNLFDFGYSSFSNIEVETDKTLISGGIATVPAGVTADQVSLVEDATTSEGISCHLTYGDRTVGTCLLAAPTPEPTEEPAQPEADKKEAGTPSTLLGTVLKIVLVVILVLIAVIVFLIIRASRIRKKKEAARRRRRKEAMRRQQMAEAELEETRRRERAARRRQQMKGDGRRD